MQCTTLIEQYIGLVRDGFACEDTGDGYVLLTPYLRPDSDIIEVFVSRPDPEGRYTLSDRGETVHYLSSFGPDFMRAPQRRLHLQRVVRSNGAELVADEIRVRATERDLAAAVDQLIHVLQEAASLSHLLRTIPRVTFREQVATFLGQLKLSAEEGRELEGAHGSWKVDFYVNSEVDAVIEAITASTGGYAQAQLSTTFIKLYDLHKVRPSLRAYALLDDQDGRFGVWPAQEVAILQDHATVLTWQNRATLQQELVPGAAHQTLS
jgi:hypothetical protein